MYLISRSTCSGGIGLHVHAINFLATCVKMKNANKISYMYMYFKILVGVVSQRHQL